MLCSVLIAAIEPAVRLPNLATLYLLPVMFTAVTWGWWPALLAAVLGIAVYDALFSPPARSFLVHNPQEWLDLVILLLVAAVTSNLAARERARRQEARRRADDAALLYELSRALGDDDLDRAIRGAAERLQAAFGLLGCAVVVEDAGGGARTRAQVGVLAEPPSVEAGGAHHESPPVLTLPIALGERRLGYLRLVGRRAVSEDDARLLATIVDQLAVAIERERLHAEARQAEILRRADELRQALLSSVTHDLRTPLAAIKASAGSLLQPTIEWDPEERRSFLMTIDREVDRLNRLVGNLLDMSRIEGGALRPHMDWYDLAELAREVLDRLQPLLAGRRVEVVAPDDLPPIEMDYLMIDQVLTNLIENAAKYSPPDSPIIVRIAPVAGAQRTCVIDHGRGIPDQERERIFDKFYRLDRPVAGSGQNAGVAGSGLGLAVCKGLVEAHGGRIWVEPTPGGGATFCFELPSKAPPVEEEHEAVEASA